MWPKLKYILIGLGTMFLLALIGIAVVLYLINKMRDANAAAIERLCQLPIGTPIDHVLPLARQLGIHEEGKLSALGRAIKIKSANQGSKVIETDDSLPGFKDGSILLGKTVAFPFERHYCEINIENRKVVGMRKRVLD